MTSRFPHASRAILGALLLACTLSDIAGAQCPDGSPPPCRSATIAAANRAAPALNDRTWIVVPFANVARTPELDWLRDASVSLLSLDLGHWTDLGVVDDKRVADLLRTLPAASATQALSLNDGIAIARRAGAGRLVMGDFIKAGRGTRLVANVFEVRTGARLRSVQQAVTESDSLLTAFGPLARAVLSVPPPPGANVGAIGTTSIDAYREYVIGLAALHRFDLTDAQSQFLAALRYDSTFALAHYKLSIAMHWTGKGDADAERAHAAAAARLGGALPPRERALIASRVASSTGDHERACATLATLVKRDSTDVEALYGLGDCRYHAGFLPPEPTADTTRGRFRGDWNGAIAMFRRALMTDPTWHPAFEHILDMLTVQTISMCAVETAGCGNDLRTFNAWVIRDLDTLVINPVRGNYTVKTPQRIRQDSTRSPLLNLREAQRIARDWTYAGPAEARAHLNLAKLDMQLGELDAAASEFRLIPASADAYSRNGALEGRIKLAILAGDGTTGRAALDTLAKLLPHDSASTFNLGALAAAFGLVHPLLTALDAYGASHGWSGERRAYTRNRPYVLLGMPLASMASDERRYGEALHADTTCQAGRPGCSGTDLLFTLAYAPRVPRTWRPLVKPPAGLRLFAPWAIFDRDTAYMTRVAFFLDSLGASSRWAGNDEFSTVLYTSEVALARGDSAAALREARVYTDATLPVMARNSTSNDTWEWQYLTVPRMMKLRADLAAALGFADEARTWYERVISLWATADPEFRPEVARMRSVVARIAAPH